MSPVYESHRRQSIFSSPYRILQYRSLISMPVHCWRGMISRRCSNVVWRSRKQKNCRHRQNNSSRGVPDVDVCLTHASTIQTGLCESSARRGAVPRGGKLRVDNEGEMNSQLSPKIYLRYVRDNYTAFFLDFLYREWLPALLAASLPS